MTIPCLRASMLGVFFFEPQDSSLTLDLVRHLA